MKAVQKLCLLCGGQSEEHEVSLRSAQHVYQAMQKMDFDVQVVRVEKDGKPVVLQSFEDTQGKPLSGQWMGLQEYDFIWNCIHGTTSEDGRIPAFLELIGVPFSNTDASTSMLTMDKDLTKLVLARDGVPVVDWVVLRESDQLESVEMQSFLQSADTVFVKPAMGGSSCGVSRVRINGKDAQQQLLKAFEEARSFCSKVMIERAVQGIECECAALQREDGSWIISAVSEIKVGDPSRFYDYQAKYQEENTATIGFLQDAALTQEIQEWTRKVVASLGIQSMARVDFLYDPSASKLFLNEVNTIPGFTSISQFPVLMEKEGVSMPEIIEHTMRTGVRKSRKM